MISHDEMVRIATEYVRMITNGGCDESHLSDDMRAWSLSMGYNPRANFWPRLKTVARAFAAPLEMTIDSTTVQDNRVAVQAHSLGRMINGEDYANDYLFLILFDEAGKIREAREYFHVVKLGQGLMPVILALEEADRARE